MIEIIIICILVGLLLISKWEHKQREQNIIEEDDQIIALFTYLLTMAYHEIPNTIKNEDLKEQIELVLDGVEDSNED